LENLNIAFIHDWLVERGGAENVLEAMLELYPSAPVFTVVCNPSGACHTICEGREIHQTFISKLPGAKRGYRNYLALMPLAIEQLDLSAYDMIVSNSYAVAKGVITGPDQVHVAMIHSPIRYAWDLQNQYLAEAGLTRGLKSLIARLILHYIRIWDTRTATSIDYLLGNSKHIVRRIEKVYRRRAEVLYPPVDVEHFTPGDSKDDFYLTASRLVPYKRIDLIVEAFTQMPEKRLVVIGDGPDYRKIQRKAGANIALRGYQPKEILKEAMQRARGFVFAAEEDFGIVPVEAQASGTPVIAYGKGGALETVLDGQTGIFFDEQTPQSLVLAVQKFEQLPPFNQKILRQNAERFSKQRFQREFQSFLEKAWQARLL
jgi:glycosyltransferase involved in cell wall biosynthesis